MKRLGWLLMLLLAPLVVHAQSAPAQYQGVGPQYSANCAHSPRYGGAIVCFDTTLNAWYYWNFIAAPPAYQPVSASVAGALLAANNLSDLTNVSQARTNLGLGTAALLAQPAVGAITGFEALEQVQPHTLPGTSTTLTCNGTAGTYPYDDYWIGTLSANASDPLPSAASCAAGSIETVLAVQDAAHTFAVTGGTGTPLYTLGTSAGNLIIEQWFDAGSAWYLITTIPSPAVALPVAGGGTGTSSTLTGLVRGGASAMTAAELSGDVTTSGSNATTVAKVGNLAVPTQAALVRQDICIYSGSASGSACSCSAGSCTYTPPAGTNALEFIMVGSAGGGGGAQTGGSAAHSGGGGAGGPLADYLVLSVIETSYTIALGVGGSAGLCNSGASNSGGLAVDSTLTSGNWTSTLHAGNSFTSSGGAFATTTTDGGTSTAPSAITTTASQAGFNGAAVAIVTANAGVGGLAGSGATVGNGAYRQSAGGRGASVNASGACVTSATGGENGYAIVKAYGAI